MSAHDISVVLISALLHALWSVAIKGSRDPLAFNVLQTLLPLGVGLALLWQVGPSTLPDSLWWVLAATGLAHSLYLYWMSRAYQVADLSLVYPIARSTPAFLPLVAIPLLGERISLLGGAGIAVVVAGMWIVQAGEGLRWRGLLERGTVFALLTLATTVAYGVLDKAAMAQLEAADWACLVPRAVVYFFLLEIACALVFVPLAFRRLEAGAFRAALRGEWKMAATAAVVSFASYSLILQALRTAPASYVVAVRQTSVLFAVALSVVWLGERPGRARVLGAAATVVGVALIGIAK